MLTSKPIIDLRIYTITVRKMPKFLDAFNRLGLPVQIRHLGVPVGLYTTDVGPLNQFIHLYAYDSISDFDVRRAARDADPEWPAYLAATVDMIESQENRLIKACNLAGMAQFLGGAK